MPAGRQRRRGDGGASSHTQQDGSHRQRSCAMTSAQCDGCTERHATGATAGRAATSKCVGVSSYSVDVWDGAREHVFDRAIHTSSTTGEQAENGVEKNRRQEISRSCTNMEYVSDSACPHRLSLHSPYTSKYQTKCEWYFSKEHEHLVEDKIGHPRRYRKDISIG